MLNKYMRETYILKGGGNYINFVTKFDNSNSIYLLFRKSTTELIVAFLFLIFLVTNAITHCSNINTGTEHLGYTTAENSANSGRSSRSRGKQKTTKVTRVSRSLSRNKTSQSQLPLFKTPINKAPPNDYGFVTPKVMFNTLIFC